MLQNFIKIAWRNLWKYKLLSGINIMGLAVAVGASIILLLTAFFQFSYDHFHHTGDRIYRVYWEEYQSAGVNRVAIMPAPFADAVREEAPELEYVTRWAGGGASLQRGEELLDVGLRYVDPDFLRMFSFPLLAGDTATALSDPGKVILSEKMAKKIFGESDPMGQTLSLTNRTGRLELTVSGIIADAPDNSSLQYSALTRFENNPNYEYNREIWDNVFLETFVQLRPGVQAADLQPALKRIVGKYLSASVEQLKRDGAVPDAEGEVMRYRLQPLSDLHFDDEIGRDGLSRSFMYGLIIIAAFILAIACINFVNLTLGGALRRALEVGVRKVLGASRRQLVLHFWGEALLVAGIALALGLILAQWVLPEFNAMFRLPLRLFHPHLLTALAGILIFVGLVGGGYPAMVLSRFEASIVLRGTSRFQKPGRLRNLLILLQFTFSVLLIACTIIVSQQIDFLRNKPLGFNKNQVISIPVPTGVDVYQTLDKLRNDLGNRPEFISFSAAYRNLGMGRDGSMVNSIINYTQGGREVQTHWIPVDYGYLETMEIALVAGRSFERERGTDSTGAIIINETFARQLGFDDPVGKVLDTEPRREVIGVMKDFHFQSLSSPIAPLSMVIDPTWPLGYIVVRVKPARMAATMESLEASWKRINPGQTFQGSFLDENVNRLYETEAKMGKIFTSASLIAILLSCMGLFGISLLVIAQRTKEIGIRKVLGASVRQIILLITSGYLGLVLTALVLASPLAWWAMNSWLRNYAYRIDIQWWVFPAAGALALLIAFATMSWQSLRAATANPVESLRDE